MVLDQGAKSVLRLVVRRVRFEDETLLALGERPQAHGGRSSVGIHDVVAELDPGLDDLGDHSPPGPIEPPAREGLARQVEAPLGVLDGRDGRPLVLPGLASGRRDLGPDHVDGLRHARRALRRGRLGCHRKIGRPRRRDRVRQGPERVVGAAHAGVEVHLRVPGPHVVPHHLRRAGHGEADPERRPRVRPQVIAAQHHAVPGQPRLPREPGDERHELRRPHAGVPTFLVDLVGGGLHEDGGPVLARLLEGGLQDDGVGGADREDAPGKAALLGGDHLQERTQLSHRSRFSETNSSSARWG